MSAGDAMTYEEASRRIKRGDIVTIRSALGDGLDPNTANRFGWTILMSAAFEGQVRIGELLLARGADPNGVNQFGDSVLWCAVLHGHLPFVELLLAHGAIPGRLLDVAMEDWMTKCSGQPQEKTRAIYDLLRTHA